MYERDQMREGGKIRLMNGIKIQLDSLSLPAKRPPRSAVCQPVVQGSVSH